MSYITLKTIEAATGLTQAGLNRHVKAGNLRTWKIGNIHLVEPAEFRRFMAARSEGQYTRQYRKARHNS
jgi:hypothetical protein